MTDDLLKNYQLTGKKYREIIELLGDPQSKLDSTWQIFYDIDVRYGSDIDPVYTKTLSILFNKKTTSISSKIEEWKK